MEKFFTKEQEAMNLNPIYATKADLDQLEQCCVDEFRAIANRLHVQNYQALAAEVERLKALVEKLVKQE
jgi:hypothetical protein